MPARIKKSLKPPGYDPETRSFNGYHHREHRSKKGRSRINKIDYLSGKKKRKRLEQIRARELDWPLRLYQ